MLYLNNLEVCYGEAQALWDVSLEIHRGEIVTLLGSNGAGKTTILRTISGLLRPKSGHIRLGEVELTKVEPYKIIRHGIAHVPEGRRLFPNMTVLENLLIGAFNETVWASRKRIADEIFQLFPQLAERRKQLAGTLSGGEQQMLAIGRALMSEPSFLMLDEPSLGLAPIITEMIFDTLVTISREGKDYSTH